MKQFRCILLCVYYKSSRYRSCSRLKFFSTMFDAISKIGGWKVSGSAVLHETPFGLTLKHRPLCPNHCHIHNFNNNTHRCVPNSLSLHLTIPSTDPGIKQSGHYLTHEKCTNGLSLARIQQCENSDSGIDISCSSK